MSTLSLSRWQSQSSTRVVPFLMCIIAFVFPISTSAKSIFILATIGLIVTTPAYWPALKQCYRTPWAITGLSIVLFSLIAIGWTDATFKEQLFVVEKYSKLIYLPILTVGFISAKTRKVALYAFIAAMGITCILSYYKYFLVTDGSDPGQVFINHIITGYLMAFASYLTTYFCIKAKGTERLLWAIVSVLFTLQIVFVNTGRTGIVIYLLLMGLLFIQNYAFKYVLLAMLVGSSILGIAIYEHQGLQNRITDVYKNIQDFKQGGNKNTAIGFRMQFHQFAQELFVEHPLRGNGTAGFTAAFRMQQPVPAWGKKLLEPHSLYWLVASEWGIVGLCLLFSFFAALFIATYRFANAHRVMCALLITFMLGNLSDSLLFYSSPGYFFLFFCALCLGEVIEAKMQSTLQEPKY